MNHSKSKELFIEAKKYIPGGVNSPVRAFTSVGREPVFVTEGIGSKLTDVDGNTYVDYICSWGPLILGHNSKIASEGIEKVLNHGTTFGMPTEIELKVARLMVENIKPLEKVRMVSSGTEATMSALRLARGYTRKNKIIKFEGCYHGHSDSLLVKSGSGTLTGGVPTSEGVPKEIIANTLVAKFNDIESVRALIEANPLDIAGIIIEPIPGNMGLIEAKDGFLHELRSICTKEELVLIFDEVISGFRIDFEGACGYYDIEADLVCYGKIIGGGMPVGAYGGKKEIMDMVAPLGGVYQAGTLSGNPIAMHMGFNVLNYLLHNKQIYDQLTNIAMRLEHGFKENLQKLKIENVSINRVGGMLCQFFVKGPVSSYDKVMKSNTKQYLVYFNEMLNQNVLIPPAQYECMFLSTEHTDEDISHTINAHYLAMKKVKNQWNEI